MVRSRFADGRYVLQVWIVTENVFNKQSKMTDRGCCSSLEVEGGINNSPPYKTSLLRILTQGGIESSGYVRGGGFFD
jgi:hypothetical protein